MCLVDSHAASAQDGGSWIALMNRKIMYFFVKELIMAHFRVVK